MFFYSAPYFVGFNILVVQSGELKFGESERARDDSLSERFGYPSELLKG